MSTYETIRFESTDGVARLTINRPERRNTMTTGMVAEAFAALTAAAADPSIRLLVLTGEGSWFCPGADIEGVGTAPSGTPRGHETSESAIATYQVPVLLHSMPAVTVAAINGSAAGAGFGWAAACDLRVATRSAKLNSAFLDVGVAGDMGLSWSLTRLLGVARARELMLIPDKLTADEAHRIGLVSRVYDDECFRDEADAFVARLAASSPVALRTMKRNLLEAATLGFAEYVDTETRRHLEMFTLEDTHEAFRARFEKRAPRFIGS